jgi:hypothetical protein
MRQRAARYASRPTLAAGNPVAGPPGYPALSRFKALFPLGPNRVGRAAQAGHRDPNPAEDLSVPTHHALATPEGIRQVAQKAAEDSDGHAHFGARADARFGPPGAPLALLQSADVTSGGGNAGGPASSTSTHDAARRPDNATRTPAGQGCNPGNVGLAQDPARHGPQRAVGRPPGAVRGPRTVK